MIFNLKILVLFFVAVAHSASVNFNKDIKDEAKDISVFDRILAVNLKAAARSRNGGQNLYQGDILVANTVKEMMDDRKRGAQNNEYRLWLLENGVREIPYYIGSDVYYTSSKIYNAMAEWEREVPCLKFVPWNNHRDYIYFFSGGGCFSAVGRQGGRQSLSIGRGCEYHGTILHEIGHALGFWHEQSRPDRDHYITILLNNVMPAMRYNFDKQSGVNSLGVPYDYDSIMHYGPYAFSRSPGRLVTIQTKGGQRIGHRQNLSAYDIEQAKRLYKCSGGGGSSCQDKNEHCEYWAKEGHCTGGSYVEYMKRFCQNSCGIC